ncbi:MAG: pilus assembly protein TadG-related protein [Actinomycetota bacterium]|nr:pilus assembly protein TadG-related protein [Actinomycetota bacterium]
MRRGTGRTDDGYDEGQATPLAIALIALGVVVALALGPFTRHADQRARARTAADAAALAGAAEGEDAAREVAEANGADLLHWRERGEEVWVSVQVGEIQAAAKARRGE